MPFIQNVPLSVIKSGDHKHSNNCLLIQITDICYEPPKPAKEFVSVHQFEFMDIERLQLNTDRDSPNFLQQEPNPDFDDIGIKMSQAVETIAILQKPLKPTLMLLYTVMQACVAPGQLLK